MKRWTYRLEDADTTLVYLPIGMFEPDVRNGRRWGLPLPRLTMASARACGTIYIIMDEHGQPWCWVPAQGADLRIIREFCSHQSLAANYRHRMTENLTVLGSVVQRCAA